VCAVCCSVLQCAAVCCSVLQCVAVCCSVLQYVAVSCSVLQCVTVCCNVVQCVCSVLQYVAVFCSVSSISNPGAKQTISRKASPLSQRLHFLFSIYSHVFFSKYMPFVVGTVPFDRVRTTVFR